MTNMASQPSWLQLLLNGDTVDDSQASMAWRRKGDIGFLFSQSAYSMAAIALWCMASLQQQNISVWLPEYFCNQSLVPLRHTGANLVFYPLTDKLEPDFKLCRVMTNKQKPDIFFLVHYFGHPAIASEASVFCKQNHAIFVEDAAHVLLPINGVGKYCDFIFYSPHKLLPIPEASILIMRSESETIENIGVENAERLMQQVRGQLVQRPAEHMQLVWRCKSMLKKCIPDRAIPRFVMKYRFNKINVTQSYAEHVPAPVSAYTRKLLSQYTVVDLERIGQGRLRNYNLFQWIMKMKYNAKPLFEQNVYTPWIPHVAPFVFSSGKERCIAQQELDQYAILATQWPDLPMEIAHNERCTQLHERLLTCAVHQDLSDDIFLRMYKVDRQNMMRHSQTMQFEERKFSEEEWAQLISNATYYDLLQSWSYGAAKAATEKWTTHHCIFSQKENIVAGMQYLTRRFFLLEIVRVNRGPVWTTKTLSFEQKMLILRRIKEEWSLRKGKLLLFAPGLEQTPENIWILMLLGFHRRKSIPFSSGIVDLQQTEDNLRKNLDSKWRNQLKLAEFAGIKIEEDTSIPSMKIWYQRHKEDMEQRGCNPTPQHIVEYLMHSNKLLPLIAYDSNDNMLAIAVFAVTENSGVYYIGWNGKEGRKLSVANLLLWQGMLKMKKRGCHWFDLGGMDTINTKSITAFKMGTRCKVFHLVGEFVGGI